MRKIPALAMAGALLVVGCSSPTTATTTNDLSVDQTTTTLPEALASAEDARTGTSSQEFDALEIDDLLVAVGQIGTTAATITHQIDGEIEGRPYTTTETLVNEPSAGVAHVSLDFTQLSPFLDDLVTASLSAEEASGAYEQSFGTTVLLIASLAADSGEYIVEGDRVFQPAADSPVLAGPLELVEDTLAEYGETDVDFSDLRESLAGRWLVRNVGQNEMPEFNGIGPLLPLYLESLTEELDTAELEQRVEGGQLIATIDQASDGAFVFVLDSTNAVRWIEFEMPSRYSGVPESHTVSIEYSVDQEKLTLPNEEQLIDEDELEQIWQAHVLSVVPQEIIDAEQSASEQQFENIDSALNE